MFDIAATCLVLTACLAYINHRFVGLPITIGVMISALALSLVIVLLDAAGLDYGLRQSEESFLRSMNFSDVLMQGMLSLLLFAGAMHVDLSGLHVSGPLAMVVAGLMVGNGGRALAMSDETRHYVDLFWELIDEILNAVLFVLIGMEVLLITFSVNLLLAAVTRPASTTNDR